MKNYSRYFMMLGLLGCLGANLSWNPELFLVSREDYKTMGLPTQEMQFASRTDAAAPERSELASGATGEVDLSRFSKDMEGVKLDYTVIDRDGNKSVKYSLKGNVGTDAWKLQTPAISQDNFVNIKVLQLALAEAAIDQVKKGRATPGSDIVRIDDKDKNKHKNKPKRTQPKITSECDEDETSDQIRCEKDELQAIMDNCSSANEDDEEVGSRRRKVLEERGERGERGSKREACTKKAHAYYKKFLQKSIKEGLSAGTNTDEYEAAIEARDSLLAEMPKKFDNTIKKDLVSTTAQGIVVRARDRYNAVLRMSKDQTTAANAAKTFILNETYGATGMNLCRSLSGENCAMAMNNPMQRSMLESNNSNFRIFTESFETRLQQIATYQGTSIPFDAVINGEFSGDIPQISPLVPDIYAARTAGQRQSAQPIPGTGQGALQIPFGLTPPSGQVWTPGRNPQNPNGQPVIQGSIAPMIPGQTMTTSPFGNQPGTYNPMAPLGQQPQRMVPGMQTGFQPGLQSMQPGYPLSPAQRQGRM